MVRFSRREGLELMLGASFAGLLGAAAQGASETQPALPAAPSTGAYWVDPISGSDGNSASQARSSTAAPSASPWETLSKAISEWNAGNLSAGASGHVEIILRGGLSYERGNALTITRSGSSGTHLVIKGYRDDIAAGTRGGTGKYTGAKGWFVLRGNIAALESGGWEADPAAGGGRQIYRTTGTFTLTGDARANWLGDSTYNLQLLPAKGRNHLDTADETGTPGTGSADVYTAPSVVLHSDNKIYVRMEPNQWTNYFGDYFVVPPTWSNNPGAEALAVYDDTAGLAINGANWLDMSFFKIEYWQTCLYMLGDVSHCRFDYLHVKGSFFPINAGDAGEVHHLDFTHCDIIVNLPPWAGWQWVHASSSSTNLQSRWDGRTVRFTCDNPHHITFRHNRFIRGFDGIAWDKGSTDPAPNNIIIENNHFLWMRDDTLSCNSQMWETRILYNYFDYCFSGPGTVRRSNSNPEPETFYVGFNILDLRRYWLRGRPGDPSGEFHESGVAALAKNFGLQAARVDTTHGSNSGVSERKYYHNLILCAKDGETENASVFAWKSDTLQASVQTERYNNIIIQTEGSAFQGRTPTSYCEQDYNIWWSDPAGEFQNNHLRVALDAGGTSGYADWAEFKGSGSVYNETKHANGQGPGSANGWNQNGKEADPDFVNGKWETIIAGDLSTYLPASGGNLDFAVDLSATGWPGTWPAQPYVGPYAPSDAPHKIGPEQGLWVD